MTNRLENVGINLVYIISSSSSIILNVIFIVDLQATGMVHETWYIAGRTLHIGTPVTQRA